MPTLTAYFPAANTVATRDGVACVYNGSNAAVEVKEIRVTAASGRNAVSTVQPVALALCRISNVVTSPFSESRTAIKHDTSSETLPSQVVFTRYPASVTSTGILRRFVSAPQLSTSVAGSPLGSAMYGGYGGSPGTAVETSTLFRARGAGVVTGVIQGITLREGEGIAMCGTAAGRPHFLWGGINVTSWNSGDTKQGTYSYTYGGVGTTMESDGALWSLFNASGSGRTLVVHSTFRLESGEGSTAAQTPPYRLVKIDGYVSGELPSTELWVGHDSASGVPSGLVAVSGDFRAKIMGEDSGVPFDWFSGQQAAIMTVAAQHRIAVLRRQVIAPFAAAVGGDSPMLMDSGVIYKSKRVGGGIMLRPGSGVAIVVGDGGVINYSAFRFNDVSITVEVTYPQIPASIVRVM